MDTLNPDRRAGRVILYTLIAYGVLVGANLGEFWPFSIYPMFSKGGNSWSRAAVMDVTNVDNTSWENHSFTDLPGEPFPLLSHGVDPIDLSNFISKSKRWDEARVAGLRKMFATHSLEDRRLLVLRVNGRITAEDSILVEFVPYALLTSKGTALHESLPR